MAKVPLTGFNPTGSGQGLLAQKPSDENLLMAAADMHANGAFAPRSSQGPERPKLPARGVRKLKVVK